MIKRSSTNDQIRARVDEFVDGLRDLIQQAALEAVQVALGADSAPAARAPRAKQASAPRAVASVSRKKGGKRIRRNREALDQMGDLLVSHVTANPGTGMSDLVAATGVAAPVVRGPLNELLAAGRLRKEGDRRGTKYFAGSGKPAAKRSSRKKKARKATTKKR